MEENWLYEKTIDNKARFVLGTKGNSPLYCFGINPSTAEPNKLDPTLNCVHRISVANEEFDSFIMFNVYAQRATDPNGLHKEAKKELKRLNEEHIARLVNGKKAIIWAAWGNLIEKRKYLIPCIIDIISLPELKNATWRTRGEITKRNHPHHPLYVRNDVPFKDFDIWAYKEFLQKISQNTCVKKK